MIIKQTYSTLNDELKEKIQNRRLAKEDLVIVETIIKSDYVDYARIKRKYNFFGIVSIGTLVLALIMVSIIPLLGVENGSPFAKTYVMVIVTIFVMFILNIIIGAYYAIKLSSYMHVKHGMNLMSKHYPKVYEDYNLEDLE